MAEEAALAIATTDVAMAARFFVRTVVGGMGTMFTALISLLVPAITLTFLYKKTLTLRIVENQNDIYYTIIVTFILLYN